MFLKPKASGATALNIAPNPYPYRGAIGIVTDIDSTMFETLWRAHRCFYGLEPDYEGVRLEMANSAWLVIGERKWGEIGLVDYDFQRTPHFDALVEAYRTPLFESLHTYGQLPDGWFSREKAQRLLDLCGNLGLGFDVWTYHGNDSQVHNIWDGKESWQGGDEGSDFYHLDLLEQVGVQFLRIPTSRDVFSTLPMIERAATQSGVPFTACYGASIRVDEAAWDRMREYYEMLKGEDLPFLQKEGSFFQPSKLWPHKLNLWRPPSMHLQLGQEVLDHIVENRVNILMNQHLTTFRAIYAFDYPACRDTLRLLSEYNAAEKVLVTSPGRLLWFEKIRDAISEAHKLEIADRRAVLRLPDVIGGMWGPLQVNEDLLQGIAFTLPGVDEIAVQIGERRLDGMRHERTDGKLTAFYPWRSLVDEQADALDALRAAVALP